MPAEATRRATAIEAVGLGLDPRFAPQGRMDADAIERIIARHKQRMGALLPILRELQDSFGHVPDAAVPPIAEALNLSRAEVHGVLTFYHDFRRAPADRPVIKLCRAEACQARGVDRIALLLEGDPRIEVETVYCLGLCASGPSAMVGGEIFARLDETGARRLADKVAG